jgi:iron only hydrogenase large subunit-like protein
MGFTKVIEAALGADMVACAEADELAEKGFLTSSCCPAFVNYIEKSFPQLKEHISHNPSPMTALAMAIKEREPDAKVIFIGPCTAKKQEAQKEGVKSYVDCVLTFEELQAWFDSRSIDLSLLPEEPLDDASFYGRSFARSGGLSQAVAHVLKEKRSDFIVNPVVCDGIEACRIALLKKSKNVLKENFVEGMACTGGCISGAGCLTHGDKDVGLVERYGKEATHISSAEAVKKYQADGTAK